MTGENKIAAKPGKLWASGKDYEPYVGRWSRRVAAEFLRWLALPPGLVWLDAGCGTGALTQTILNLAAPSRVSGLDLSEGFIAFARGQIQDSRVHFEVGDAQALPFAPASQDVVVSGLALNFIPDSGRAMAEMRRVVRPGGTIAAYVWDYAGQMQLMRYFWDAAVALDPAAAPLDEGPRFPLCHPEALQELFKQAGLEQVAVRAIDIATDFNDFNDYWFPFLGGQGPAPAYVMALSVNNRKALRERLQASLPVERDGSIHLIARAWAVRGIATGGSQPPVAAS
jgi:SAM-dependent methyltransferase